MKKIKIGVLILFMFILCQSAFAIGFDEESATSYTPGTTQESRIPGSGEFHYYKFSLTSTGYFTFTMSQPDSSDLSWQIYEIYNGETISHLSGTL